MSTEAELVQIRAAIRDARDVRDRMCGLVDWLNKYEDYLMERQDRERAEAPAQTEGQ